MSPRPRHASSVPGHRFVYLAAAVSALGGMLFGYDTGVISGAVLFIRQDFSLSATAVEAVVSAVLLGAVVGAVAGGTLSDRFGRRTVLVLTAVLFTLGALGTALAPSVLWLITLRVMVGVAIGLASFITPLYISEVSPVEVRGRLVSFNQVALTTGIVLAYLADYALSGARAWRVMLALAAIPSAIFAVGMLLLPESPRWLIRVGRIEQGRQSLRRIRGSSEISGELQEIEGGLAESPGGWAALANPKLRLALIAGIGLAIFQQTTGINTVIYYAPTIFQAAGFHSAPAAILATMGVGIVNLVMTIVALQLLDRVGRRPLLLTGMAVMVISLVTLGMAFLFPSFPGLGAIAVGSLMLYVGAFAVGLGPVFWLLIAEIYPLSIRGVAMSIATVANWGANLLVALTFLTLIQLVGRPATFWLYGAIGAGAWIFAYVLVPETKGRSLEEIESHWRTGRHPREMRA